MNGRRWKRLALLAAILAGGAVAPAAATAQTASTEYEGAAALGLGLRRLGTAKRVLMIAAHPDDEDTQLLSALALGQGAEVAYLSLTRGEGGQNSIGPELQEALGLIRTEELLAARRLDGAAQFFTRAYDFGFSKSADETFSQWPRDSVLADVVAVIRAFRPDVVVAMFSGTPRDGHGQHQASGLLAREAFEAAGDPARFPEHFSRGLRPHAPARFYRGGWIRFEGEAPIPVETGTLDPLLGRSYHQVAMASRSRHRSQDMGQLELPGPRATSVTLLVDRTGGAALRAAAGSPADAGSGARPGNPEDATSRSIFGGMDTTLVARATSAAAGSPGRDSSAWRRVLAALRAYETEVEAARGRFNPMAPDGIVPGIAAGIGHLAAADSILAGLGDDAAWELRFLVAAELRAARSALARAAGIVLDAVADDDRVVPGQSFHLELTLWNGGARPITVEALEPVLPAGWRAAPVEAEAATAEERTIEPGRLLTRRFRVEVPPDAAPTEPYFLREPRAGAAYRWAPDEPSATLPFEPPAVRARATVTLLGASVELEREAAHRTLDRRAGEVRRPVLVVPAVSVTLDPGVLVLPLGGVHGDRNPPAGSRGAASAPAPLRFTVRVTGEAPDGRAGELRLVPPAGWRVEPASTPVRLDGPGAASAHEFTLHLPAGVQPGEYPVRAVFESADGARYDRGYQIVDYPHIRPRPLYREAASTVRAFDVRVAGGVHVAYIMGGGDEVPQALAQLGVRLEPLAAEALAEADLDRYDVIVTGVRAYETQPALRTHNGRLLEWVERGGVLIVQYNQYTFSEGGYAPYPLTIARPHDRVTDERSPVRLLEPSHPVLSWPNRIGPADFEGWIQERGLYFPRTWDERYVPLLEMNDLGEAPMRGALLVARHGKGVYVYTGLAFFRQLPAGVPGAYRLFANLLSLGAAR